MNPTRRTVLFVISYRGGRDGGNGGAYQDVRTLSEAFPDAHILVLGKFVPSAFSGLDRVSRCELSREGIRDFLQQNSELARRISVVHAYDRKAVVLGRSIAIKLDIPLIMTKAGGPAPASLYPFPKNLVVVQKTDEEHFARQRLLGPSHVVKIANRVRKHSGANPAREDPFDGFANGRLKILCVARICAYYYESILQAVELNRHLNRAGIASCLVIIGEPNEPQLVQRIEEQLDRQTCRLHTAKTFYFDAFEHIAHADVCVGAGRVLMETLSAGKFAFFPVQESVLPCFLSERTYQTALDHNFSMRTDVGKETVERGLQAFLEILDGKAGREELQHFLKERFREDIEASQGAEKLLQFYDALPKETYMDQLTYFTRYTLAHLLHHIILSGLRKSRNWFTGKWQVNQP